MGSEPDGAVDIVLLDAGRVRNRVYSLVARWGTGLDVKKARKLVDAAPGPIITGMPAAQAEAIKLELEAVGAVVELRPSEPAAG